MPELVIMASYRMQHVVLAVDSYELLIFLGARVDHETKILAQGSCSDGGFVRQAAHCNGREDEFNYSEIIYFSEVALCFTFRNIELNLIEFN